MAFPSFQISKFSGGACPQTPLESRGWRNLDSNSRLLQNILKPLRTVPSCNRCPRLGPLVVPKTCALSLRQRCCSHILSSRTSKVPCLMRLLCSLLLAAARYSFTFSAQHVPGVTNQVADAVSSFSWQEFRQLVPHAQPLPTPNPPSLLADLTAPLQNGNIYIFSEY